jgi:hypothetical protein
MPTQMLACCLTNETLLADVEVRSWASPGFAGKYWRDELIEDRL